MATTSDIRDIMDLGRAGDSAGPKPGNKKKKKIIETQPRLTGMSREVQALMGDSVPPVSIVETPKYKTKPSLATKMFRPRHWEELPFEHGARQDGLALKHWKRALPRAQTMGREHASTAAHDVDVEMKDGDTATTAAAVQQPQYRFEPEYPMEKWNIKLNIPSYTDEQYEQHFRSDDWSKAETDYLLQLAQNLDLRWIIIGDRYDPQEIPGDTATYQERSTEALKLRYYEIAAKDLELKTPRTNMNETEYALWQRMKNFDAKTEIMRKNMAEKLFERTKDEAEEEKTLLEELGRITKNEEEFIALRRDLYARLEAAPSLRRNERGEEQNIVLSSAGLSDLLSRLFAKEKHLKRRVVPNPESAAAAAAAQTAAEQKGRQPSQINRRETVDSQAGETPTQKKSNAPAVPKLLTPAEEAKFGVSRPTERLVSGVMFRHEKINRITTAKSQVQTQKINAALTELEIPARLSMPTEKVCKKFEQLVSNIQLLLDARKTLARVTEEVKTLEEMKRMRLGLPKEEDASATANVDGSADQAPKPEGAATAAAGGDATATAAEGAVAAQPPERTLAPTTREVDEDDDAEADEDTKIEDSKAEADDDDNEEDKDDEDLGDQVSQAKNDEDDESEEDEDEDEDDEDNEAEAEDDDDDDEIRQPEKQMNQDNNNGDDDDDEDEEDEEEEEEENDDAEEQATVRAEVDEDEEEEDENVEADESKVNTPGDETPTAKEVPAARPHKRSASVLSNVSQEGSRGGMSRKKKK